MHIATLSGWGQSPQALEILAPGSLSIDYARHHSIQAALLDIAAQTKEMDMIIGWSLGGQLAVRAIAAGLLTPRALVLIAAPFQFVATPEKTLGMKRGLFEKFHDNYERNPERTLNKAWELVAQNDTRAEQVRTYMRQQDKAQVLGKDWRQWLKLLDGFSCAELNLSRLPPTLLIHGEEDTVVDRLHADHFAQAIPQSKLISYPGCGHAPHWHDTAAVKHSIHEFMAHG